MPSSRKHCKQTKVYSTSDDSDSDSESYQTDSISICEKKEKHHKKKHCEKKESDCMKKEKHHKKDCMKKESDSDCEKKEKHHKKHIHHKKKHSESSSSSVVECYSNEKKEQCESSSSSSDSCEEKYKLCDIYDYFKNRLVEDNELMVSGSTAYLNTVNNITETIPNNHAVTFNTKVLNYNIENVKLDSPFFVREDGIYIAFFVGIVDSPCQFSFFVDGVLRPLTCVGTNSGAGQVVSRHMIDLKKNSSVVIRSYISAGNSFKSNLYNGGSDPGNDLTLLMMKIAPLCAAMDVSEKECCELMKCLSHDKKRLFKCLTDKLECDKELMVHGFNVAGTFSNTNTQVVATESAVIFDTSSNVTGLGWVPSNGGNVNILEDGVYKVFFLATTPTPAQFAFAVNGNPIHNTTQGSSKGAGQITIRSLLELKQGDVVSVLNHVSANGSITINSNAGGSMNNIATILTIFKIAPLVKPTIKMVDCKLAKRFECYYKKFRTYLLCKENFMIAGTTSYTSLVASTLQTVNSNDSFYWPTTVLNRDINHIQGHDNITIMKSGLYDVFVDICTDEPLQYALFVNGNVVPNTIFGRDSGANRCLMRQFVLLNKGDNVQVINYLSYANPVNTAENAGGQFISQNALFMAFMLHPLEKNICDLSGNSCK